MYVYDNEGNIVDVEIVPGTVDATVNITSPSKEVPIKVVPKGDLAFGKSIKSMVLSTTLVTIYGEQEAVDKINQLEVEIDELKAELESSLTLNSNALDVTVSNGSRIAPSSSKSLIINSILAILIAVILILIYIAIRFELLSGLTAILILIVGLLFRTLGVMLCLVKTRKKYPMLQHFTHFLCMLLAAFVMCAVILLSQQFIVFILGIVNELRLR